MSFQRRGKLSAITIIVIIKTFDFGKNFQQGGLDEINMAGGRDPRVLCYRVYYTVMRDYTYWTAYFELKHLRTVLYIVSLLMYGYV